MQIHLKSLGCRLNEAELEQWAIDFKSAGHDITAQADTADLVVVNTCAVTQEAVRKSSQMIRRTHRNHPAAKLLVTGCFATLQPSSLSMLPGVDLIVPNDSKDRLVEIAMRELEWASMPALATVPGEHALFARGRNRAFIKIQDGCRYRCTFCIVTVARGEERSRSIGNIVRDINGLGAQGIKEIVLTGVHVGGYGSDIDSSLYDLIHAILADTDMPRVRLTSVEPWDLPSNFFRLFDNPRLMPHMHLPLQSGSDSVLRRMARRCKTTDFARLIDRARQEVTDFNVTTDVIVGFPRESQEEWQQSLEFIERIGFSHIHIFSYSPRAGTKAAGLAEQVPKAIKQRRSKELHALAAQMKSAYLEKYIGRVFPVLWEKASDRNADDSMRYAGYTPNYLRVNVTAPAGVLLENQIHPVRILSLSAGGESARAELEY